MRSFQRCLISWNLMLGGPQVLMSIKNSIKLTSEPWTVKATPWKSLRCGPRKTQFIQLKRTYSCQKTNTGELQTTHRHIRKGKISRIRTNIMIKPILTGSNKIWILNSNHLNLDNHCWETLVFKLSRINKWTSLIVNKKINTSLTNLRRKSLRPYQDLDLQLVWTLLHHFR